MSEFGYPVMIYVIVDSDDGPQVTVRRPAVLPIPPVAGLVLYRPCGHQVGWDPGEKEIEAVAVDVATGEVEVWLPRDDPRGIAVNADGTFGFTRAVLFDTPGQYYYGWEHVAWDSWVDGTVTLRPGYLPGLVPRRLVGDLRGTRKSRKTVTSEQNET